MRAIEEFDGLRALRLEGNTIGVEAAQTIAKALQKKSDLQVRVPYSQTLNTAENRSSQLKEHDLKRLKAAEKNNAKSSHLMHSVMHRNDRKMNQHINF